MTYQVTEKSKSMGTRKKHLFSPFKRNQMRWALVICKWKTGCSWNQYHLYMADELGVKDLESFEQKISNKDIKRFVVEGRRTTEEKLEVFEKFIRKVLPDYLTNGNEEEHLLATAKSLAQFSNGASHMGKYFANNCDFHLKVPSESMFVAPIIDEGFEIPERTEKFPTNIFKSFDFCVVRQISDSPFLFIQMFAMDLPDHLTDNSNVARFLLNKPISDGKAFDDDVFIEIIRTIVKRIEDYKELDDLRIRDYRKGIVIPIEIGHSYALMTTKDEYPVMADLNIFKFGKCHYAKPGYYLSSDEGSYDARKKRKDDSFPHHIKILSTRADKNMDQIVFLDKYVTVNTIPKIKEMFYKMRVSLL